ncbi:MULTISPECIES: iron hydrogenase small subunit [Desulfovibrio]|uniref:Ferredoxin hydrogenase small subunit n=2 Tax=Desulfovibrio desulfuricans TaxID=876 RepID=A0AA94L288_DESDE|nr:MULTISPECIES: iron hydrogenase small subunit [Desulfovibrio]ATD81586.1 iron hydrogenase [Desulfovibrio sp. G11]MDY0202661.1 iron hydrogenase small subunit [Desulfovibrio desulfuricans]SFW47057.1 ferredoxin hydrogenase small subunit [Desulfovibrio desulfuricans]SPD34307.1 ferredoxin hydrogenase [Desulfovibrio sp. G11]
MSIISTTRRGFLKGACILSGGLLLGVRMVNKAHAAVKDIKDYMADRTKAVYGADAAFPKRASQDNAQVKALYDNWLGKPLGHKSEELLHTSWFDKSKGLKALVDAGLYPNPRHAEFAQSAYPYE